MAKIGLEKLIQSLPARQQESSRALPSHSQINRIAAPSDSIVDKTRAKLSPEEAGRLGSELAESFASSSEALEAQGAGLTEDRVRALLEDD